MPPGATLQNQPGGINDYSRRFLEQLSEFVKRKLAGRSFLSPYYCEVWD
jgi:hypothetical protein